MTRILIVCILVVFLTACAGPGAIGAAMTGSGKLVSQTFDVTGFSHIEANGGAQVEVTRGDAFGVVVEVDDNLASRLDVGVSGSTLRIKMQDGSYRNNTLRAKVTMPQLTGLDLNGGSTLRGELAGEDLTLIMNGGSRLTLTGSAGRVTIDINGGAQASLGGLSAEEMQLEANGGGQVEIGVRGVARGQANGGAIITLVGSPTTVDIKTDGGAHVRTR